MKITLLGDSIRLIGYGTKVPELLGDGFEVYQPSDNCRYIKYTMRGIGREWKEEMQGSQLVHWNNGIWDTDTELLGDGEPLVPLDEYVSNVIRTAKILMKHYGKLIFATTTPLHPLQVTNLDGEKRNKRIAEYNAAVVPTLREMGVVINDLYSLVYPKMEEYILPDRVHLNADGIAACAEQTARIILEVAGK